MSIPLTVPGTTQALQQGDDELHSANRQHVFPVVHGVPVLFPPGGEPTFDAYRSSQSIRDFSDAWQVDTLAINAALRERVRKAICSGIQHPVDPVVSHLIMATNGMAYESSLGKLTHYPIPILPLAAGEGGSFLDIGCSWGRWCVSAARLGYRAHGIDPSLGAVLAAQRIFRQFNLPGTFVCGDGRALPFPDDSFDVVHSYSVLQHFSDSDVELTFSEIGRVLKAGGLALIQMANMFGMRSMYHLLRRGFRKAKVFEVRYRRPAELARLGEKHVGPTELSVDCFGGLGLQKSDAPLYRRPARLAVSISEHLKKTASALPPLRILADSLYVRSVKTSCGQAGSQNG